MVARILSGYSIRGLLNYNESKVAVGDATLILANRFAVEVEKLGTSNKIARFERLNKLNGRAKRNAMHIMLNFDRSDKLSQDKITQIASTYMEGIGFGNQPYLVYQHQDVSHPHIHIVSTNIQADGSRIDFHNIGKSISEIVRKNIELEFGLVIAQGKNASMEEKISSVGLKAISYGKKPTKQSIYNVVMPIIRSYTFITLAEFNAILKLYNVVADRGREDSLMFERGGLVYAVLDTEGNHVGVPIKASSLAGGPTLKRLEKKFADNQIRKKAFREPLKKTIDEIFANGKVINRENFIAELNRKNIDLVLRRSNSGQIYGITFIDHNNKCVFNGSDLGKAYSAKAILDRFDISNTSPVNGLVPGNVSSASSIEALRNFSKQKQSGKDYTGVLEVLLQKPDLEPPIYPMRKKKKKKQQRSQSIR